MIPFLSAILRGAAGINDGDWLNGPTEWLLDLIDENRLVRVFFTILVLFLLFVLPVYLSMKWGVYDDGINGPR